MNSEDFFKDSHLWKGKQGIYVIEQPLFKNNSKEIYKVGFARDSLYKRIRDYKTAYGPIHFTIHILLEVPEKVFHQRPNFARLTEGRIHQSLSKELVMKNPTTDRQEGEWFFNIEKIVSVIKAIKDEYINDKVYGVEKWLDYFNPKYNNITPASTIVPASSIKSKLNSLVVQDRTELKRSKTNKQTMNGDYVYY